MVVEGLRRSARLSRRLGSFIALVLGQLAPCGDRRQRRARRTIFNHMLCWVLKFPCQNFLTFFLKCCNIVTKSVFLLPPVKPRTKENQYAGMSCLLLLCRRASNGQRTTGKFSATAYAQLIVREGMPK